MLPSEAVVVDVAPDGLLLRMPDGSLTIVGSAGWEGVLKPGQRVFLKRGRVMALPDRRAS